MRKQGYRTSFLYGGYGYFDNMNHFFESNGFSVSDRKDIENPDFANIWGVSDLSLFRHAADYFDKEHASGAPFFSIIMSTSNHKPYTFAPGTPGVPEKGGGRLAGVRYADYALGEFIKMAETRPWFDDTLFVIVADHGARVYGKAQIPLGTYEIPMLLYSPAHIPAREETALASQMDLAPTVLGLLGFEYRAPFFGQDALNQKEEHTLLFNHNYKVATYRDETLTLLSLRHAVESYHYDKDKNRFTAVPLDAEAVELTTAYFQTGFELFKQHRY